MEVSLRPFVAIGRRVRDVVRNGRQAVRIRVQPSHARIQRGGNGHRQCLSAASTMYEVDSASRHVKITLTSKT